MPNENSSPDFKNSPYRIVVSDRHEPVLCVVALVPTFMDRGTILCALLSESVTTPSHVPILKQNSHHTPILPKRTGDNANVAGFCLFRALVTWINPFFISKCQIPVKVIHQTVLAVIRTMNTRWLLRMDPRCQTAESANAHPKFKGMPGSYAVRSPWISYMPIQIPWLRVRRAMQKMRTEFLKSTPACRVSLAPSLKYCLENS